MRKIVASLSALAILAVAGVAFSNAAGTPGSSGKGGSNCTTCHAQVGLGPQVEILGTHKLDAGSTGNYRFRITVAPPVDAGDAGDGGDGGIYYYPYPTGVTIAADNGVNLIANNNGGLKGAGTGELVQLSPQPINDAGEVEYVFSVKAPDYGGYYSLYAAGLVGNGDNAATGDSTGAATFAIQVNGPADPNAPPPPAPTSTGTTGGGGGGTGGGGSGGNATGSNGTAAASNDSGGCDVGAVGSGSALGALLLLPAIVFAARRRRKQS